MAKRAERVAVTGVGMVSALGSDARTTFARLCAGESGIAQVKAFDTTGLRSTLAAEVPRFDDSFVPSVEADLWSRSDRMAVAAAREALAHAGLTEPGADLGLAVGGTTGGMLEAERILVERSELLPERAARRLLSYPLSTSVERLAQSLGARGHAASVCSACSSGANAVLLGASWIESGRATRVLAGGTDALCRLTFSGFNALGVMSAEPCRPFDVERAGLTLGEGAAFLMLESEESARARGALVLAWLDGWAVASEAHHITHPEPSGATASRLLTSALARAGLEPADVDYVNAHGTATLQNDAAEARALAGAFGPELGRLRVSSSKGQVGHTLGAAGALEAAFAALAVAEGLAPPTGGLRSPDPSLGLRHVIGSAEALPIRAALSSSFGFGGAGTVLAFTARERARALRARRETPLYVLSVTTLTGGRALLGAEAARAASPATGPEPLIEQLDPTRSRRFDRASALVTLGASAVTASLGAALGRVGLVTGSAYGNVERSVEFLRRVFERGPRFASPADFPHLVPSAPGGNAAIYLGLGGPVLAVADLATSAEAALCCALSLLEDEQADAMVAGGAEPHDEVVERLLAPLYRDDSDGNMRRGEGASFALVSRHGSPADVRVVFWTDAARPEELPPPSAARARVFSPAGEANARFVSASSWRDVPVETPSWPGVPAEARGGFGLARAVAALLAGEAEETLWVSAGRSRAYAFAFARGAASS